MIGQPGKRATSLPSTGQRKEEIERECDEKEKTTDEPRREWNTNIKKSDHWILRK